MTKRCTATDVQSYPSLDPQGLTNHPNHPIPARARHLDDPEEEKIQDAFGDKFGNGVMSGSAFIGGFACAFGLGWLVALVMCAMLPFMGVGAAIMGKARAGGLDLWFFRAPADQTPKQVSHQTHVTHRFFIVGVMVF